MENNIKKAIYRRRQMANMPYGKPQNFNTQINID